MLKKADLIITDIANSLEAIDLLKLCQSVIGLGSVDAVANFGLEKLESQGIKNCYIIFLADQPSSLLQNLAQLEAV